MRTILQIVILITLVTFVACGVRQKPEYPFQDMSLPLDERIDDLLSRLTPEEKIMMMMNRSTGVERLDIPDYDWWNEALHGVARAGRATVFPQAIGLAAAFDEPEHYNTFTMISDEARAKYHKAVSEGVRQIYHGLTFWTPNINIFRDPRWGRGMETYGEDPYLTGRLGLACVRGLQGDDPEYFKTHACAKHYAVHSGPEWNRHYFDISVSERDLWETYLPAFEQLVKEGDVQEVMCAYNRFEGDPCCGSDRLLIDILRHKWGFDGIIVSDCGAINDFYMEGHHETHADSVSASIAAVLSGTDLECGRSYESLIEGYRQGLISEEEIDVSLRRLLGGMFRLGMFDDASKVHWTKIPYSVVDSEKHRAQALKMARESMTLMKNENGVLPLGKDIRRIAVVGPNADDSVMQWANYNGFPSSTVTILQGIKDKLPGAEIIYEKGCNHVDRNIQYDLFSHITAQGETGMKAEFFNNTAMEGNPAHTTTTQSINYNSAGGIPFAPNVNFEDFSAKFTGTFTAPYTGKVYFSLKGDDGYKFTVDGETILEKWGRDASYLPSVASMDMVEGRQYNLGIDYRQTDRWANLTFSIYDEQPAEFSALKERIKDVDAIIFVGGLSPRLEGEEMPVDAEGFRGGDRENIDLPYIQKALLGELRTLGKPVVFVLCTGSALALTDDEKNYDALLNSWYGGQACGTAVADVLFGDYNPAGRLPVTFYRSLDQIGGFLDYDMQGRTYRYMRQTPLYPFGHGLSYTTFLYDNLRLSADEIKPGAGVDVTFDVTNSGDMDGDEVVQVYVKCTSEGNVPVKSLKGFRRISTQSGQKQTVTIHLDGSAFETFDPQTGQMKARPGRFTIMCGGSSADAALVTSQLTIQS